MDRTQHVEKGMQASEWPHCLGGLSSWSAHLGTQGGTLSSMTSAASASSISGLRQYGFNFIHLVCLGVIILVFYG